MSSFLRSYLVVGLAGLLPVALALGALALGRFVRPRRPGLQKELPYESGAEPAPGPIGSGYARYYLYALVFVVFDVEVAFIVPWAVQVEGFGGFGLVEMLVFAGILALGVAYAWRKGVFSWDS